MSECANCGQPILQDIAPEDLGGKPEPYWYHPKGDRTWCYDPGDPEVEPDKRLLRAEPASAVR